MPFGILITRTPFSSIAIGEGRPIKVSRLALDTLSIGAEAVVPLAAKLDPRGGGGGVREIAISGLRADQLYSRDHVRGLLDALNDALGDGYKLKVA